MFPSSTYSNGPYPYPCFPSSSSSSYPFFPFLNPENNNSNNNKNASSTTNATFIHDPLCVPYIPIHNNNAPIAETVLMTNNLGLSIADSAAASAAATIMPKQDPSGAYYGGISCLLAKKPAKKDRHSKIYTSQGLRDRRVRLSIEIARKFFDLQDMLGFDKASNTLDWLFNKSKKAIKELARSKNSGGGGGSDQDGNNNNKSFSTSSDCDEDHTEVVSGTKQLRGLESSDAMKERSNNNKLKKAQKENATSSTSARAKMKESREKARARARERTSNKMCNNNNIVTEKKCSVTETPHHHPQILQHSHLVGGEGVAALPARDDFNVIEESIVIKRKLKPSMTMVSSHHHHHQNSGVMQKEESTFNNNSDCHFFVPNNLSPNWDNASNSGSTQPNRSNFCAIASMNLSTGLQIFGKSWEECTNPRLH